MTTHDSATVDFTTIKARQQIAWSAGDYSIIGATLVVVSENLCCMQASGCWMWRQAAGSPR